MVPATAMHLKYLSQLSGNGNTPGFTHVMFVGGVVNPVVATVLVGKLDVTTGHVPYVHKLISELKYELMGHV